MPAPSSAGDKIVSAACDVVRERGLARLTVSAVAARAGTSSALVHYHFDTKQRLIVAAARSIATRRSAARAGALAVGAGPGLASLDALWSVVMAEVGDGRARAYLELIALARSEATIAEALAEQRKVERRLLSERLPELLAELGVRSAAGGDELAVALEAFLDGVALELLGGTAARVVRAAYDSFWLALIAAGQAAPER